MLSFMDQAKDGLQVILLSVVLVVSRKKTWHNIVGDFSVYQACPIVVDKPAGDLITILDVDAEVLLPMPAEKILLSSE